MARRKKREFKATVTMVFITFELQFKIVKHYQDNPEWFRSKPYNAKEEAILLWYGNLNKGESQ